MNRIEAGKVYKAVRFRSGTGKNGGAWELIVTQDERGYNELAVFAENIPCGVKEGENFRVEKISNVSFGMKKGQNDEWRPSVSVNAVVTPVSSYDEYKERAGDDWNAEDGECPF